MAQSADTILHSDTLHHLSLKAGITDGTGIDTNIVLPTQADTLKLKTTAHHGYVINGKVEDMNTGEGLPFTIVYFPHTGVGTTTDLDGNFVLRYDKLPSDTLHVEALGYQSVNKLLRRTQYDYNYILMLSRSKTELNEFTVHAGEDPAVVLLRHIIAHKPENNPDKLDNYKYEAYNKLEADLQRINKNQFEKIPVLKSYGFVFNNIDSTSDEKPFLPLYLTEALSDYYFQREPKKQREFIKATMVRGVKTDELNKYLGSLYQNINVYRNYISIFDKKFVSPISNDGLYYYKYTIKDTQQAYGHKIILVHFRPKRPGENCFTGDFWVVDSVYAIQRVSMDVAKAANLNWVDAASLYQEFAPIDSFWFCIKDKFVANFSVYNSKKLPGFIGRKTATYHKIAINTPEVAKVVDDPQWKEDVTVTDSSRNKSDVWWNSHRPDSLSKTEKAVYKMVDTINSLPITRVYNNTITFLASGVKDIGPLELGPYFYIYSHNPTEGDRFRISLGTPRSLNNAHVTGFLAYGDKDKRFKYGGTGLWILERDPRMYVYGYYIHDVTQNTNYYGQLGADNIFSTLFRKAGVPWKLAFANDYRFEFYKQYHNRFSHKLILQHRDYTPYSPLPSVGIFEDKNDLPATHVVSTEVGIELRYAYREKYLDGKYLRYNLNSKYPIFTLEVTAGLKNVLGSAYQYQKARFAVHENINIPPLGHLYYNVFAGKYFGTLPYPLLEIHPGNEYYYYNQYAFEMMNTYEFISDQYMGFNLEHNVGGGIFNHIPGVKKLKLRQFWTAKGVIGSVSDANYNLNFNKGYPFRSLQGNPYLELGTGVSNILQIFRIDFVWRVSPMPSSEEARSRYFGIFGSVRFQF